jgi:hypothetical protein
VETASNRTRGKIRNLFLFQAKGEAAKDLHVLLQAFAEWRRRIDGMFGSVDMRPQ